MNRSKALGGSFYFQRPRACAVLAMATKRIISDIARTSVSSSICINIVFLHSETGKE